VLPTPITRYFVPLVVRAGDRLLIRPMRYGAARLDEILRDRTGPVYEHKIAA
jgi:hypothetical protein